MSCPLAQSAVNPADQSQWFVIRMDGKPIGYEQLTTSTVEGSPTLVKVFRRTEMRIRRLGSEVQMQAFLWTTQTTDGQLLAFDLQRIDAAGNRIERSGAVARNGRSFEIKETVAATKSQRSIRLQKRPMSPVTEMWLPAAMASTINQPTLTNNLAPSSRAANNGTTTNRRQHFDVFFPETLDVAKVTASILPFRQILLPDGQRVTGARLEYSVESRPSQPTRMLIALDKHVIRKEKSLLNRPLTWDQASADLALEAVQSKTLDLTAQAVIPVDRLISFRDPNSPVQLRLTLRQGFLGQIPKTIFQTVDPISSGAAIIKLKPVVYPGSVPSRLNGLRPVALPPTTLMPTADPMLQRMASRGTIGKSQAIDQCLSLEKHVGSTLTFSPFSTNLLPANTVAKQKKGDCTEHAILLATLMKIRGIQARIASGLILTPGRPGFTGHVWVEAQIQGNWYPFDSTSPMSSRQVRIKLAGSSFDEDSQSSGLSLFTPILDLAGRSSFTVESAK
ncbi:MAG: transglutaminase family protein [Fuerstiella sp.]